MTAKAIHVWELRPQPDGRTLVTVEESVEESMDGPLMAAMYPSEELAAADHDWLLALKQGAERER